jgi:hypothetical protein
MLRWKARVTHRDPTFKAPEESVSASVSVRKEKTVVGSGQREKWNASVSFLPLPLTLLQGTGTNPRNGARRIGLPLWCPSGKSH